MESNNAKQPISNKTTKHTESPVKAFFVDKKLYLFCLIICLFCIFFVPLLYLMTITRYRRYKIQKDMRYKWKPSKTQKREFAERMATDTAYSEAYHQRKEQRAETRRSTSKFDYQTAGGEYIPTGSQNKAAFELLNLNPTPEQKEACNMVLYGYSCKEKVHHDFIHLINEYIRNKK